MQISLTQQLKRIMAVIVVLFLASVLGYVWLEQLSWIDAVYMTVITLSTVGFGEVEPLSPVDKALTIFIILLGVGTGVYLFSALAEYIVAGQFASDERFGRPSRLQELVRGVSQR